MQFYMLSNMRVYTDGGEGFLVDVKTGETTKMESALITMFPHLFLLKWKTRGK